MSSNDKCRICGCTENNACVGGPYGTCWWVEDDLCSACEDNNRHNFNQEKRQDLDSAELRSI